MLRETLRSGSQCAIGRTSLLALAVMLLTGCGGDDGTGGPGPEDPNRCRLSVTLSGALEETLQYDYDDGCSGNTTDVYTELSWGGFREGAPINFGFFLNGSISKPSNGNPTRAQVTAVPSDDSWDTPATCVVDITASAVVSTTDADKTYSIEGKGSCPEPAVDASGKEADVTIGDFTFRALTTQ